jgi:arginine exporter protein ArgO
VGGAQIMYIIGASAAFSRMAITLIHDTLTHLTVPMIQLEMLLPIVGVVVATHAPEHNVNFIKASCALASACWFQSIADKALCYAESVGINGACSSHP